MLIATVLFYGPVPLTVTDMTHSASQVRGSVFSAPCTKRTISCCSSVRSPKFYTLIWHVQGIVSAVKTPSETLALKTGTETHS